MHIISYRHFHFSSVNENYLFLVVKILLKFNLIGFSGGAYIAVLLAADRDDIKTLRTVSGNLNNDIFIRHHKLDAMPASAKMPTNIDKLSTTPQYHFIGEDDEIIPIDIYRGYANLFSSQACLHSKTVKNTDHTTGWSNIWQDLLTILPKCNKKTP